MECSVYDTELNRIGVIDSFVSLLWEESYNDIGFFQMELAQTSDNMKLFKTDLYVGKRGSDTLMVVKLVQITDGKVLVTGNSAEWILSERVSTAVIQNQNAETALRTLVNDMQPWPGVALGEASGVADKFTAQFSDASVLEYCQKIGQAVDMGFRLRHDRKQKKLFFECYKPPENTDIKFSTAFGNMTQLDFSESTENYKNVAVVAGAGESAARVTVYAGKTDATGVDRRELYVDARNEQPEENETDADYKARLVRFGEAALVDYLKIQNIQFVLDDPRAKLGDVVFCSIPEFGFKVRVRIVGITETTADNKTTREATLGEPIKIK